MKFNNVYTSDVHERDPGKLNDAEMTLGWRHHIKYHLQVKTNNRS